MLESPVEKHAERLAWLNASWTAIDLRLTHTFKALESDKAKPAQFDRIVIEYVETASGWRRLSERSVNSTTGKDVSLSVHWFDGSRGADLFQPLGGNAPPQITIHRHFSREDKIPETIRPIPLYYQWVGRKPLHEAIREAEPLGRVLEDGKPSDAFLFASTGYTGDQDRVYYLDPETSVPVKVVTYLSPTDRELGRPLLVWRPVEVRRVQGYPFVWTSREEEYAPLSGVPTFDREYRVEAVVFNKIHANDEFRPDIQQGALVIDTITKQVVHGPHNPGHEVAPEASQSALTHAPIRAEVDGTWSNLAFPLLGTAGAFLLVAAFWLSRRRS